VVDSLSCTILGSATKRLKESDLVVTQPSKQLRWIIKFGNPNTTVWKFKNNRSPHLKVSVFAWRLFLNMLPSKDNLMMRNIICHNLNFVWLDAVDWKQLITCSFLSLFSPLCGVWLDLGLEYLHLIRTCYKIISFSLFILLEDCKLVVLSSSLFGYLYLSYVKRAEQHSFQVYGKYNSPDVR